MLRYCRKGYADKHTCIRKCLKSSPIFAFGIIFSKRFVILNSNVLDSSFARNYIFRSSHLADFVAGISITEFVWYKMLVVQKSIKCLSV
jgi:hypothetical protein